MVKRKKRIIKYKPRECNDCGKQFQPTSGGQPICRTCRLRKKGHSSEPLPKEIRDLDIAERIQAGMEFYRAEAAKRQGKPEPWEPRQLHVTHCRGSIIFLED